MRSSRLLFRLALSLTSLALFACDGDAGPKDNERDAIAPVTDGGLRTDAASDAGDATFVDDAAADAAPDASDASDAAVRDGGTDGADASDAGDAALVDGGTDGAADASDAGVDPCAAGPFVVQDGGTAPSRTWCQSFTYATPAPGPGSDWLFDVHAGFSPNGIVTLYGTAGEAASIAGTALPASAPFAVRFDASGNPTSALALPMGTYPDAGAGSSLAIVSASMGSGGAFAFGGAIDATYGEPGFLWTYDSAGAPRASDLFSSTPGTVSPTNIAAIAPLAGGDFAVAGWAAGGPDFGTGPQSGLTAYGSLFVARFTAAGSCAWVTPLGSDTYHVGLEGLTADAAGNIWVQTLANVPDAGPQAAIYAARFDAATGSPKGVFQIDPPAGTWGGTPTSAPAMGNGDGVTMAIAYKGTASIVSVRGGEDGWDGVSQELVFGQYPTTVTAIASDGAGGAIVTGMTQGGAIGSMTLPTTDSTQCFVARLDAAGNATWAALCGTLPYSVGTSVAVSGHRLVLVGTAGVPLVTPLNPYERTTVLPGAQPSADTPARVFVEEYALP